MIPNCNVVVLGARGSGKTVFLASMDSKLSVQNDDIGFSLSLPLEQRQLLAEKFEQVAFRQDWPPPTRRGEISEWHFTCNVVADNRKTFPALEFTYIDYAGGVLTEGVEETYQHHLEEVTARIKTADALLGIIDGHKVYALMDSSVTAPRNVPLLYRDLHSMIPLMADQSLIPVHFILSKWDLLHGKYSLEEIRDRLLQFENFANLVQQRRRRDVPIRLIPVSSVGMSFAELQDGIMEKLPGHIPKPFQVEMPISHVLMDRLEVHLKQILAEEKEIDARSVRDVPPEIGFWAIAKDYGADWLQRVVQKRLPPEFESAGPLITKVVDSLKAERRGAEEQASVRVQRLRRERDESLRQVQDHRTSTEHAIRSFKYLMDDLSRDFPASDLRRS